MVHEAKSDHRDRHSTITTHDDNRFAGKLRAASGHQGIAIVGMASVAAGATGLLSLAKQLAAINGQRSE